MYLVAIAWVCAVLPMSVAEAMSPRGGLPGALFAFVLYGVLPLATVMPILGTPARLAGKGKTAPRPRGVGAG